MNILIRAASIAMAIFCAPVALQAQTIQDDIVIAQCVSPRTQIELSERRLGTARIPPTEYYVDVAKSIRCITEHSSQSSRRPTETLLRLRRPAEEKDWLDIGGAIGPYYVRVDALKPVFDITGMVYIGGEFRAPCAWTYQDISVSLVAKTSSLACTFPQSGMVKHVAREHEREWLEDSFYDYLEMVLDKIVRLHTRR